MVDSAGIRGRRSCGRRSLDLEANEMKRSSKKYVPSSSVDLLALADYVEQFSSKTVVLFGDFVADEYQFGEISRVSREAPVLILRHRETHFAPGGGANAANNLAALGTRVFPISAVGDDPAGEALLSYFRSKRVDVSGILRVKGWTTPTKTRFLAGWAHTVGQQVLRVDYEPVRPLSESDRKKVRTALLAKSVRADALAVSDYGLGVVNLSDLRTATACIKKHIPVTLDSRYRLTDYKRAGITSATPNEAEIEALHHTVIGNNLDELERCGSATLHAMKL